MNANEVRDMINEQLWANSNPASVKVKDFKFLDDAVSKLTEAEDKQEFKSICEQYLESDHKNSIAVRYLITIVGRHPMDDRHILSVLEQYYDASLWDEVMYIGNKVISFNESAYALRVLAECYDINKMVEKKVEIWERLVKIDFEETDVLYKIADYYEKKGDFSNVLNYYRSIIRRHIKAMDLNALKNVWEKVVALKADNTDYLLDLACKISDSLGSDNGVHFLYWVYDKGQFDTDKSIEILKKIIRFSHSDTVARDKLIELWKTKYAENPRLDYCLKNTGILNDYMNINISIENFEKEIQFVEGAFVYHETRKLGKIQKILKDEMQILFSGKGIHTMSCEMAFSSLKVLPKSHIWVLKAAVPKEKLVAKFMEKDNVKWGLRILLSSFGNQASIKQMKAELVPTILDAKQWTTWLNSAKKELSTNPYFGTLEGQNDIYVLRTTPITFKEKMLSLFKGASDIYDKIKILKDFIAQKGPTDSDEFSSMVNFFEHRAKTVSQDGLVAFLVIDDLKVRLGMNFLHAETPFIDYYNMVSNKKQFFLTIQDSELKKDYIENIMNSVENWQKDLIELYPLYMTSFMADCIRKGPKKNVIPSILAESAENAKENPDFFLYLVKTFGAKEWAKAKYTPEGLLILKLTLLSSVNRKIANSTDVADNKKRQKTLLSSLFSEDKEVLKYLEQADESQAQKIYSIIKGISDIENERLSVKHFISNHFKDWESITGEKVEKATEKTKIIPKGLLCTKAMLDAKKQELDHIMNVEIPENSKEIGTARELGDLRENAEYQYGKDKQKNLNFLMNKLTDEVSSAQVILPENVDTTYVSFGTKVTFHDNKADKDVVYTIFGPWESDPNKNILNFKAPLGQKLYNLEKGENTKFTINGVDYDYTVLKIELADF